MKNDDDEPSSSSEHISKRSKTTNDATEECIKEKTLLEEMADHVAQADVVGKEGLIKSYFAIIKILKNTCILDPLQFAIGDKVRNKYNLGGIVTGVDLIKRTYTILYNDGRSDENLDESFVKPPVKKGYYYIC